MLAPFCPPPPPLKSGYGPDGCIVFLTYIQWFFITDFGWRRGIYKNIRYRNACRYSRTCICIPYLHVHCLHRRSRFKKSGGLENIGGQ